MEWLDSSVGLGIPFQGPKGSDEMVQSNKERDRRHEGRGGIFWVAVKWDALMIRSQGKEWGFKCNFKMFVLGISDRGGHSHVEPYFSPVEPTFSVIS